MIGTAQLVVLIIATGLVVAGLTAVVWRDLGMRQERIGPIRRTVEALVPLIGVSVMLGALWAWAGSGGG